MVCGHQQRERHDNIILLVMPPREVRPASSLVSHLDIRLFHGGHLLFFERLRYGTSCLFVLQSTTGFQDTERHDLVFNRYRKMNTPSDVAAVFLTRSSLSGMEAQEQSYKHISGTCFASMIGWHCHNTLLANFLLPAVVFWTCAQLSCEPFYLLSNSEGKILDTDVLETFLDIKFMACLLLLAVVVLSQYLYHLLPLQRLHLQK